MFESATLVFPFAYHMPQIARKERTGDASDSPQTYPPLPISLNYSPAGKSYQHFLKKHNKATILFVAISQ